MSKNIVILGAGYGGVAAAKRFHKLLKREPQVTITLIDKNPFHTLLTELHEVAGNRIESDGVQISLKDLFQSTRVNYVKDEITDIDFKEQTLKSEEFEYAYDYLIIGSGSRPSYCGVEGAEENSFTLWSIDDAEKINEHIRNCFQKARVTTDPNLRKGLLSFSVCGGGFTGVEMVGELIEWLDDLCYEYDIPRSETNLYLCEGLDRILPNLKEKHARKAMDYLHKKNVRVKLGSFVQEVKKDRLIFADGEEFLTRTVIWNCGVVASDFASNLGLETDRGGRIKVNDFLQTANFTNVYAIGDNAAAAPDGDRPLPALVETALQTGETAANNIVADMRGQEKEKIDPKYHGILVSIGGKFAVADVMGISMSGWPAMFMKHMVNIHYMMEIGGLKNSYRFITKYLVEQGSHKGFVAQTFDHITQKSWTLPLVVLRVFLGVMWLLSGLDKVHNGWLVSYDKLVAGASTSPIGPNPVSWYVDFMEAVVFPYPALFQIMITLGELALATSLILGIFSLLGGLGSVFMTLNFFLSGFYPENPELPWYLVTSIATLSITGKSFGADYYLLPWLKRLFWGRRKNKNQDLRQVTELTEE